MPGTGVAGVVGSRRNASSALPHVHCLARKGLSQGEAMTRGGHHAGHASATCPSSHTRSCSPAQACTTPSCAAAARLGTTPCSIRPAGKSNIDRESIARRRETGEGAVLVRQCSPQPQCTSGQSKASTQARGLGSQVWRHWEASAKCGAAASPRRRPRNVDAAPPTTLAAGSGRTATWQPSQRDTHCSLRLEHNTAGAGAPKLRDRPHLRVRFASQHIRETLLGSVLDKRSPSWRACKCRCT